MAEERAISLSASSVRPLTRDDARCTVALGAEIRRRRLAAEVGVAELGRLVGVSEQTVRQIEQGTRRTRRSTLERMACWLIPVEEWAHEDGPSDEQELEVVEALVAIAGPALGAEKPIYPLKSHLVGSPETGYPQVSAPNGAWTGGNRAPDSSNTTEGGGNGV